MIILFLRYLYYWLSILSLSIFHHANGMIEYEYDEVVVGGNISSLVFAIENKLPIISTRWEDFQMYDRLEYDERWVETFEKVGIPSDHWEADYKTHTKKIMSSGLSELLGVLHLYHGMYYPKIYCPFSDGMYFHEGKMRIIASNKFDFHVKANTYHVFDADQIKNKSFEVESIENKKEFRIVDYIRANKPLRYPGNGVQGDDFFVNEIITKNVREYYAISYLNSRQINRHNYADYAVRFKAQDMMKAAGITGYARADKPHLFRGISLRPQKREIYSLEKKNYKNMNNFRFPNVQHRWELCESLLKLDLPAL